MHHVQERMKQLLERLIADGRERGVQVAAYLDGELVVDTWAGTADPATGRPVDGDTLFPVFSVTKGMAVTLMHIMVDRGLISYEMRVAEIWPEFAAEGKQDITLQQLLGHAAGLPSMPMGIGYREFADWDRMVAELAKMRPEWPAGTKMMYHAVTYGWLLGEVLRRVSGKCFRQLLRDEITGPLGISQSMFVGIPDEAEPRVAVLDQAFVTPPILPDDSTPQPVPGWMQPLYAMMNRPDARRTCAPASNGIMSARAIARHYAALLPGGIDGIELLPPERIRLATRLQKPKGWREGDVPWGMSLGYFIGGLTADMGPRANAFGHGGHGGSMGYADPEKKLAVGLTKNLFSIQPAHSEILRELRDALRVV